MSAVLTTPDVEQVRAFRSGREDALASIYRSEYDALVTRARTQLGDDLEHHAPRIAQNAMCDAWNERARFETPEGLVAYLEQAVTECVAVQRRKHAALHRHGNAPHKSVVIPSADEAVTQLLQSLHAPTQSHDELVAEAHAAKKHHAAEHVQKVGASRSWKGPLVLVGSLVVAAFVGVWYMDNRSEDVLVDRALEAEDARFLESTRGQRGTVTLNDDSEARMGSDTRIRMPRDFGGNLRTLELTGVAHFDVAPDNPRPFRVRAGSALVTASGTSFSVRAYEGDSIVLVAVTEGSVDVELRGRNTREKVTAGNAVQVSGGAIVPIDADARETAIAWLRDTLVFVDAPVRDVLPELARWYGLTPTLADASLGERRVTMRLALQSAGDAIRTLADSARLQIGFDADKEVVLHDANAPPSVPGVR